jgi:hypothetical protein
MEGKIMTHQAIPATNGFLARVTKIVRNRRIVIAEHVFVSPDNAHEYLRNYKPEFGYETSVHYIDNR